MSYGINMQRYPQNILKQCRDIQQQKIISMQKQTEEERLARYNNVYSNLQRMDEEVKQQEIIQRKQEQEQQQQQQQFDPANNAIMLQLYEKISALEKSQSKQASDDLFSNNNKGSRKTIESLATNTANLKLLSSKVSNLENQFQQLVKHVNTRSKYSPRNMINGVTGHIIQKLDFEKSRIMYVDIMTIIQTILKLVTPTTRMMITL